MAALNNAGCKKGGFFNAECKARVAGGFSFRLLMLNLALDFRPGFSRTRRDAHGVGIYPRPNKPFSYLSREEFGACFNHSIHAALSQ
jgi:hypothetical protein